MWIMNNITGLMPLSTMTLYCTPRSKQNKCPESALPLLQPWPQLWLQHSALFSQNAPACHSFCPSLGRYSRQCPETRNDNNNNRVERWFLYFLIAPWFNSVSVVLHECVSWLRHGGERKGEMEEHHDISCRLPCTSINSWSGKVNCH